MAEKIGLMADLDLTQWDLAVAKYMRSIEDMKNASNSIAGSIGSGFGGIEGLLSGVAGGITSAFLNIGSTVIGAFTKLASELYEAYQELGKNLLIIVGAAATAITAALFKAGQGLVDWTIDGIKANTEFEQSMADIASVLRKTRDEVDPLADKIDDLALDPNLVVSTGEASAAIEQLARNGIGMADIVDGAAESVVLLANATGTGSDSFAKAADIATMAMQMFKIKAMDMNHVADVSQGVINNSRIELDDWALALGNGGAAAGIFGVSLDDFATAIAGTVNLYHTARQAGTGMTNFLERLVPLTEPAADEMRKLGLFSGLTGKEFDKLAEKISDTQQKILALDPTSKNYQKDLEKLTALLQGQRSELNAGSNAFFDANGNLKDLSEVSEILRNATKDLSDEEQIEAYRRIFGNDALRTAVGLADLGADAFNNLQKEIVIQGSAAEAAATRTKTLAARWENLQDIWLAIQRKSGAGFNDMLLKLVNRLTELTNQNQDRIISFFGRLAELFSALVDAAMPWIEKTLPMVLDNLEALASWLIEVVLHGDKAQEWFDKMDPSLQGFLIGLMAIINGGRDFISWLIETGKFIYEAMTPYIEWIQQNVTLKDALIAMGGAIAVFVLPGILKMIGIAALAVTAVATIRKGWEEDWFGIRTIFEEVWPLIQGPLVEFVNDFLTGKWGEAWDDAGQVVKTVLDVIIGYLDGLNTPFSDFIILILEGEWQDAWTIAKTWAVGELEKLKTYVPNWGSDLISIVQGILTGNWQTIWVNAGKLVTDILFDIGEAVKELHTPIGDFIADVLQGKWGKAWDDAKIVVSNAMLAVGEAIRGVGDDPVKNFIADILEGQWAAAWLAARDAAINRLTELNTQIPELFSPFINLMVDVLLGEWPKVWEDMNGVVTATVALMMATWENLKQLFLTTAKDSTFPEWLRKIFIAAYAISKAFEAAAGVIGLFYEEGNKGVSSSGDWEKSLSQLATDIRQIAEFFEAGSLSVQNFVLSMRILTKSTAFQDTTAEWEKFAENQARIQEIGAAWREEIARGGDVNGTLKMQMFQFDIDPSKTVGLIEGLRQKVEDLRKTADITSLSMQQVNTAIAGTGKSSLEEFAKAYTSGPADQAKMNVLAFASSISEIAGVIKNGWVDAGDQSVYLYVQELAKNYGIGAEGANKLATIIINSFGSRVTDWGGGVVVPNAYENAIVKPFTDVQGPAGEAANKVGFQSMLQFGAGLDANKNVPTDFWSQVFEDAQVLYDQYTADSGLAGSDSVQELAQGISDNKQSPIDITKALTDEIDAEQKKLIGYGKSTGQESVAGLGTAAAQESPATTGIFSGLTSGILDKTGVLPPTLTKTGQTSVEGLGTGANQSKDSTVGIYGQLADAIKAMIMGKMEDLFRAVLDGFSNLGPFVRDRTSLEPYTILAGRIGIAFRESINGYLTVVTKNFVNVSDNANTLTTADQIQKITGLGERIGTAFRDGINKYLTIVINNFVNLADNIKSLTDLQKFTDLGTNIGNALKTGLDTQLEAVKASATALVTAAQAGITETAEIASPSKLFQRLAGFLGEGFILGLHESFARAQAVTSKIVEEMASSVRASAVTGTGTTAQKTAVKSVQGMQSESAMIGQILSNVMNTFKTSPENTSKAAYAGIGSLLDIEKGAGIFGTSQSFIPLFKDFADRLAVFGKTFKDAYTYLDNISDPTQQATKEAELSASLATMVSGIMSDFNKQISQKASMAYGSSANNVSNYSSVSSPVNINNYIYNQMDQAQLEYMMDQRLNRARLA